MNGRPWTHAEEAKLRRLHAQGRSWTSIARALARSKQACATRLSYLGVTQRKDEPAPEECQEADGNLRRCHDCGCPTHDFRCARCRRKWQIRNGAPTDEAIQNMHAD